MTALSILHGNGSNGATYESWVDSVAGNTIGEQQAGTSTDLQLTTTSPKFGSAAIYFPAEGGDPSIIYITGWSDPKAGDYSFQVFFKFTNNDDSKEIYIGDGPDWWGAVDHIGVSILLTIFEDVGLNHWFNGQVVISTSSGNISLALYDGAHAIALNTWYHFAVVRDVGAGTYSAYFNGDRVATTSDARDSQYDLTYYTLQNQGGAYDFYLDEIVFTNDVQFSGTTYTVPTEEFSAGIDGTADVTEGADTASAAGQVVIDGEADATEGADTSSAAGGVVIDGTASITEGADTSAATGYGVTRLEGVDGVAASESAALTTAIGLAGTDSVAVLEVADLTVPIIKDYVDTERQQGVAHRNRRLPSIPPTTRIPPAMLAHINALKETIEFYRGLRGGSIDTLADNATDADVLAKLNELINRMQS